MAEMMSRDDDDELVERKKWETARSVQRDTRFRQQREKMRSPPRKREISSLTVPRSSTKEEIVNWT
jgi:hypothetical protein